MKTCTDTFNQVGEQRNVFIWHERLKRMHDVKMHWLMFPNCPICWFAPVVQKVTEFLPGDVYNVV